MTRWKKEGPSSYPRTIRSYQSYHVPISEVLELWEFTCSINTQEYDERDLKLSSIIKMFTDLKVELETFVRN